MSYPNGQIPLSALATTYLYYPGTFNGRQLLEEVAPYAEALATAFYLEFNKPLYATDGYRDLATQWVVWRKWQAGTGAPAAIPGTSNHGKGKALDLASNVNHFGSAEHKWMRENAGKYGWAHPYWARQGGGREEAWHWEFVGGGSKTRRILRPRSTEVGLGATGTKVQEIQRLLNDTPGVSLQVDGHFGLGTAIAVFRYQEANGHRPGTGRVSAATLASLRGEAISEPTRPSDVPTTRERVKAIQEAIHAKADGIWGADTGRRVTALSAASAHGGHQFPYGVRVAQNVVGATMDGDWGPASERAHRGTVARVQRALGIEDDGLYGPYTAGKISVLRSKAT